MAVLLETINCKFSASCFIRDDFSTRVYGMSKHTFRTIHFFMEKYPTPPEIVWCPTVISQNAYSHQTLILLAGH